MGNSAPGRPETNEAAGLALDAAPGRAVTTISIVGVNVGCIVLLTFLDWPNWWRHISYELSALTWFSSVQLILIAACCLLLALLCRIPLTDIRLLREQRLVWLLLAGVFVLFALDERFQIRERLRETALGSTGATAGLPGVGAGEIPILVVAAVGLFVAYRLYLYFGGDPATRVWLLVGVVLALASTVIDVADLSARGEIIQRNQQFTEEILETLGQMGLFVAFTRHAWRLLEQVRLVPR
jgi:hypothetical protein